MKISKCWICVQTLTALLSMVVCFAPNATAQDPAPVGCTQQISPLPPYICQGDKGVYNSSAASVVNSHAYIDASVISATAGDVCAHINGAFSNLSNSSNKTNVYTSGMAVIDARGVTPSSANTPFTCMNNPWVLNNTRPSVVVLLPPGTIPVASTWYLPKGTKLVGEGIGLPIASASGTGTTLQATSALANSQNPWMIQMGTASGCTGVSIENLTLDGNGTGGSQVVNGINNSLCGDLSYVDHVSLYRILGVGLNIASGAEHSGPYSNITFNTADVSNLAPQSTECASIMANGTHGFRQITCSIGQLGAIPTYAIRLDGSNNLLQDIRIEGFQYGIAMGTQTSGAVSGNILKNIDGDSNPNGTKVPSVAVIDIAGANVTDLAILGLANTGTNTTTANVTILDSALSSTTTTLYENNIAMYVIGEPGPQSSYTRFTTSPYAANWSIGNGIPPATCKQHETFPIITGQSGSLYADAGGGNLYVCTVGNTWQKATH